MEALQIEVSPFGIETMIVNPGFFRTELLTEESTQYAELQIDGYCERRAQQEAFWTVPTASRAAILQSSRRLSSRWTRRPSFPVVSWPAPMPSPRPSKRLSPCSSRLTPIANCRAP